MRKTLGTIVASFIIVLVIYMAGIGFYADRFVPMTQFYHIDISNLTMAQAEQKIEKELGQRQFTLTEAEKTLGQLDLSSMAPTFKVDKELKELFYQQNPNVWLSKLLEPDQAGTELEEVELDQEALVEQLKKIGVDNAKREPVQEAQIEYDKKSGYYSVPGKRGTKVDPLLMKEAIAQAIIENKDSISLESTYERPLNEGNSEVIDEVLETIDRIASVSITFELAGDEITIPKQEIESWLYFGEGNDLIVDEEAVREYLEKLNDKYATFDKYREFESTWRGVVTVEPGILGWGIDIETETRNLVNDVQSGHDVTRTPALVSVGNYAGQADEIGPTYIEIDLANQYMFLYVDHQLVVETPIVSGQPGAETVPGAGAVIEMLTDTKLRGTNPFSNVDYATPVKYWIRFDDKDQGIHDASWQGAYGGDVWTYAGSLGCINTPLDAVITIYNYVTYGTPVIVF